MCGGQRSEVSALWPPCGIQGLNSKLSGLCMRSSGHWSTSLAWKVCLFTSYCGVSLFRGKGVPSWSVIVHRYRSMPLWRETGPATEERGQGREREFVFWVCHILGWCVWPYHTNLQGGWQACQGKLLLGKEPLINLLLDLVLWEERAGQEAGLCSHIPEVGVGQPAV